MPQNAPQPALKLLERPVRRGAFLIVVAALLFAVPYFVPVKPNVSLSYVVGFSNRTAILIFVLGTAAYAILSGGELGRSVEANARLSRSSLFLGMAVAVLACLARRFHLPHRIGFEAYYALNRIQMLASGHRPYLDFDYNYGPLQLYVPVLLAKLLRCSVVTGFYTWWMVQWAIGTAMLWATIQLLDVRLDRRTLLFWAILLAQLVDINEEGTAYTPIRMIGSAFFLVVVHAAWKRWRRPWLTVLLALAAVAIELGVSPEQGIAVAVGVLCWFGLLAVAPRMIASRGEAARFPLGAVGVLLAGIVTLMAIANHLGLFILMFDFAGGALALPLLPTPVNVVILFAYVAAACAVWRDLRRGNFEAMSLPLALGGFAMLPAAMGRCDMGHLQMAAGAFLLGIATIESHAAVRRWWSPIALLTLIAVPLLGTAYAKLEAHRATAAIQPSSGTSPRTLPTTSAGSDEYPFHPPCATIYRTPTLWVPYYETSAEQCLDTGYYRGMSNVITQADIRRKISELDQVPRQPLLVDDKPLAVQLSTIEDDPAMLYGNEESFFVPRARHAPLTYQQIQDYIEQNYTPDPNPIHGMRVWRPKRIH